MRRGVSTVPHQRWVCDGSGHSANPTRLPDLWDPWWVVREVADAGWSRIWVASRSICALATEVQPHSHFVGKCLPTMDHNFCNLHDHELPPMRRRITMTLQFASVGLRECVASGLDCFFASRRRSRGDRRFLLSGLATVAGEGGLPSVLNEHRGIVKDRFYFFIFQ